MEKTGFGANNFAGWSDDDSCSFGALPHLFLEEQTPSLNFLFPNKPNNYLSQADSSLIFQNPFNLPSLEDVKDNKCLLDQNEEEKKISNFSGESEHKESSENILHEKEDKSNEEMEEEEVSKIDSNNSYIFEKGEGENDSSIEDKKTINTSSLRSDINTNTGNVNIVNKFVNNVQKVKQIEKVLKTPRKLKQYKYKCEHPGCDKTFRTFSLKLIRHDRSNKICKSETIILLNLIKETKEILASVRNKMKKIRGKNKRINSSVNVNDLLVNYLKKIPHKDYANTILKMNLD